MSFRPPENEKGAALLAVLLIVAVIGAVAAASMDRLNLAIAASANADALDQARHLAGGLEELALAGIEDGRARSPSLTTLAGGWNGAVRRFPLPVGEGEATLVVTDGGNCFNLNSLVERQDEAAPLTARPSAVAQFAALMRLAGLGESEAQGIAAAAADWADSDSTPVPGGGEDEAYAGQARPYRAANQMFAEPGELRAVRGVTAEAYERLRPFLCALPVAELSPINVNTLLPGQAALIAMLAPDRLGLDGARRLIAGRPSGGWRSVEDFRQAAALEEAGAPLDVSLQPQIVTRWFSVTTSVESERADFARTVLVDARLMPARIVAGRWSEAS